MESICGLDEAGRGALAGPLVLAAVVLPQDFSLESLKEKVVIRDSKKMSFQQRLKAYAVIQKYCLKMDTETISVDLINQRGIQWANEVGFKRLIERNESANFIIDGRWKPQGLNGKDQITTCVIDADATVPSVIASGIVAKVTRDDIMLKLHQQFSKYFWNTNFGYGTLKHIQAITQCGVNSYHRTLFVETALKNYGRS